MSGYAERRECPHKPIRTPRERQKNAMRTTKKTENLRHIVNGFLIGIANIIPGMSGGTLALVLGIYERLIAALRNIRLSTVKKVIRVFTLKKAAFADALSALHRADVGFLALLGVGAVTAVLLTSKLIVYLLNDYHDATYGFFSGLILTSIAIPARMLRGFGRKELLVLLIAVALIIGISLGTGGKTGSQPEKVDIDNVDVGLRKDTTSQRIPSSNAMRLTENPNALRLTKMFACGALAISAMILPGISGSFLMLAFGVYFPLLTAINGVMGGVSAFLSTQQLPSSALWGDLLTLAVFALGCLFGLVAFTRLLNYLLERYRNLTIAFLIGLMVGSLYGLWPFRDFAMVDGERVDTAHILPQLDANLFITLALFLGGCGVVRCFSHFSVNRMRSHR